MADTIMALQTSQTSPDMPESEESESDVEMEADASANTDADHARASVCDVLDRPIKFLQLNPKLAGSKSAKRYEAYKHAATLREMLGLGGRHGDITNDLSRGFFVFTDGDAMAERDSFWGCITVICLHRISMFLQVRIVLGVVCFRHSIYGKPGSALCLLWLRH